MPSSAHRRVGAVLLATLLALVCALAGSGSGAGAGAGDAVASPYGRTAPAAGSSGGAAP
ncbi:hypothetical protein HYE82_16845, partial [Streptomyces sp. BR123]|nr:hypothetical protein [Streptomyces sp. BR123]